MQRELGTERQDMPHEFVGFDECRVCGQDPRELRHREWERINSASRVTASAREGLPRVSG